MRDARKSCSRRWAGNATTVSGGFAIRTELVVLGARDGSVARKRGRDARARDRSEREFRSRARARRKGGASRTRPRPEEEGVPLFARQIVIMNAFVLVSKRQDLFLFSGFSDCVFMR